MKKLIFILLFVVLITSPIICQQRKIIIDCDPGVDDAMALILAIKYPSFDIIGITTVFGNAYIDQTTNNALSVVELSRKNIPVYKAAEKPLRKTLDAPPDFIHGKDGLGNTYQPKPKISCQQKSAARFIVDIAKTYPHEIFN